MLFHRFNKISTPGILNCRSEIASGALSSDEIRPARRSVILPELSIVQKSATDGYIAGLHLERSRRLQSTTTDLITQRVEAEQASGQVPTQERFLASREFDKP